MPTVLLLDVSLSMTRPVVIPDCNEEYQRRNLAIHGINTLLDHLTATCKLEFVSLLIYSSLWEQLVPFTRDYESIKSALNKIEDYDKTCLENSLGGVNTLVVNEWGTSITTQVILITDGSSGIGPGSLKHSLQTMSQRNPLGDDKFPLPFDFPSKFHVMCISGANDPIAQNTLPLYQKLIDVSGGSGDIFLPEGALSLKSSQQMFTKLCETHYAAFHIQLQCGNLKCNTQLFPPPDEYNRDHDFESIEKRLSPSIEICGFIDISDLASPQVISRHLVLPLPASKEENGNSENKEEEEDDGTEDGKTPSFTVLLHGSLKVENMVALAELAPDWYGFFHSWADSKKKSNLMLSIMEPGNDIVPWLGNIKDLAPIQEFSDPPFGDEDSKTPFPVKPTDRRSYAQNCVVWIKPAGLQADIQKILRHARKLPEKQQHFYKELNRLRRAALSFGFLELLEAMSMMLDRECTMLPGTAHPDAAMQLSHAANSLRHENAKDINQNVMPLRTNFSTDD